MSHFPKEPFGSGGVDPDLFDDPPIPNNDGYDFMPLDFVDHFIIQPVKEPVDEFIIDPVSEKISSTREWAEDKYSDLKDYFSGTKEPEIEKKSSLPEFDFPLEEEEQLDLSTPDEDDWNRVFGLDGFDIPNENEPDLIH